MIEVEHLSKIYGSTVAIQDVDFSVNSGEILGFLGPNGAGKTTTMRILAGYIPSSTGTARIAGYDVHEQSMQVRQRIGYLPENPPLYPDMTVESFINFVAQIKGIAAGDRIIKVNSAIERCQLTEKRSVLIRKLSKGYKQRVGIAQAIVHDPPVIILDEPTVGLDPKQIIEVRNLIKSLAGQHTVILSTHILPEVSMTCDRATIINRGKVVKTDIPANPTQDSPLKSSYKIEVEGDITPIIPLLKNIPEVIELQVNPIENNYHSAISILAQPNQEIGKDIAAIIVNSGLGLLEMRRDRPTLEDIFLEVVGTGEVK
ncbi:MFS transporter [Aphanothece hegewaldii CCALA 016]|uniref:MFS transporter n=1 Tax=Aphanothece hegewaldii CCALA 016 TaxID=2107694 RepID=A0A2T1M3K4_9CHRO|nr:ABC transporter ATP-binding protein [Aphanothece hegewaldii]PSF39419.1 MFS transporter [Aphanothece hegewaldii CCALA 016]